MTAHGLHWDFMERNLFCLYSKCRYWELGGETDIEENLEWLQEISEFWSQKKLLLFPLWKGLFIFRFATLITVKSSSNHFETGNLFRFIFKEAIKDLELWGVFFFCFCLFVCFAFSKQQSWRFRTDSNSRV